MKAVVGAAAVTVLFTALQAGCAALVDLGPPKQLETSAGDAESGDAGDAESGDEAVLQPILVAVGPAQACAVIEDGPSSPLNGTVRCWGSNASGELGQDPSQIAASSVPLPVSGRTAPLLANVGKLTLGSGYSCAITADGYLQCWGLLPVDPGVTREEVTPLFEPSTIDVVAKPLAQVTSAAVGEAGGCCTLADQSLVCWGPVRFRDPSGIDGGVVAVADGFDSVALGRGHGCAHSPANQDVVCWGDGSHGQAGGSLSASVITPAPVGVGSYGPIVQIAAGGDDSCALVTGGDVYCWGANDFGQLGAPGPDSPRPTLVTFGSKAPATEIAMGDAHGCALLSDLTVWCWGDDSKSQLGQGGPTAPRAPAEVLRLQGDAAAPFHGVQHIAAGGATTCATLLADPHVYCWGDNTFQQAGQSDASSVGYATSVAW